MSAPSSRPSSLGALGALDGKADPAVTRAIRGVAAAVTRLEAHPALAPAQARALDPVAVTQRFLALQRALQSLQQQITSLTRRVRQLEASTAGLTPVPTDTVTSPLGVVGAGSALPTVALADLSATVAAYAAAHPFDLQNSCQSTGGTWAFMDGLVAALVAVDPRVGYNGKRGNTADPSQDAISYYHGNLPAVFGSADVYVVDVIVGHCGATPTGGWGDVTAPTAAGAWMDHR